MMRNLLPCALPMMLAACNTLPPDAFKLPPTSLEDRQLQSRKFLTLDHSMLLLAGAGVLQDLGYVLDASNGDLGVLTASKDLDATNTGQIVGAVLLSALSGTAAAWDKEQKVRVCLVINRVLDDPTSSIARVTVQRLIWNTAGQVTKAEAISDPALYQAFFEKLSQATFLEANQI